MFWSDREMRYPAWKVLVSGNCILEDIYGLWAIKFYLGRFVVTSDAASFPRLISKESTYIVYFQYVENTYL